MFITRWSVVLVALGVFPAWWFDTVAAVWLWVIGVAAVACLDAMLAPHPRTLGVQRRAPESVRLTESTQAVISVANLSRSRTVVGAIRDAWPPSAGAAETRHSFRVEPAQTAKFTTTLTPTRRGDRKAADVTVRLTGPLRLAGKQRSVAIESVVRVLPEFASRRHLPARLRRLREIDGQTAVHLKGAGSEFDSLREYVIGDDVRSIDWRATARRADVVVRTYRPERDRRVFIVLDTSRLSAGRIEDAPRLDASIEAALLLSALATKAGDRVQTVAFDRVERARAAGTSAARVMPELANALATVEPALLEPDWLALVRLVQGRLSQRALVVLLTTIDVSNIDSGLIDAVANLAHDHQVLVGSVDNPELTEMMRAREDTDDLYSAGAAARAMLEHEAVASRLRQFQTEVVTAVPDELAPAIADRYLALKASGRL